MSDKLQAMLDIEELDEQNIRSKAKDVLGATNDDLVAMDEATETILVEKCDEYDVDRESVGDASKVVDTMLLFAYNRQLGDAIHGANFEKLRNELLEGGQPAHNDVSLVLGTLTVHTNDYGPLVEAVFERKYGEN